MYKPGMLGEAQRETGIFESQVDNFLFAARGKAAEIRLAWRNAELENDSVSVPHPRDVQVVISASKPALRAGGGYVVQIRIAGLEYTDAPIAYCDERITRARVRRALVNSIGHDPAVRLEEVFQQLRLAASKS